jgi:large subunit ribosomal protein L5
MSFIKEKYKNTITKNLKKTLNYKNDLEIPRMKKISLNIAFKATDGDSNFLTYIVNQLSLIAGQKAVLVKAKKAISSFKLKEDMPISCIVTLRKNRMFEFLDRLVYIVLPRIRDFRGLTNKSFNQSGHYNFSIKEHTIFPEIELDKAYKNLGINVNIVTTAKTPKECEALLKEIGFPIK